MASVMAFTYSVNPSIEVGEVLLLVIAKYIKVEKTEPAVILDMPLWDQLCADVLSVVRWEGLYLTPDDLGDRLDYVDKFGKSKRGSKGRRRKVRITYI